MKKSDKDIIALLCEDARLTPKQIAAALNADEKAVAKRISELEAEGVIVKYTAIVNTECFDDDTVEALIEVKVTPQKGSGFDAIAGEIAAQEEVQNLYLMSGGYDLAVIVRGKSLKEVSRFVSEKISTYAEVLSTATHFILKKYKVESAEMNAGVEKNRLSVQA